MQGRPSRDSTPDSTRPGAMDARVRLATREEAGRLREIERASAARFIPIGMPALAADEPTDVATLHQRSAAGRLLVSEDERRAPIGFVMFREVDGCAYIEQIDVLPAHAGRRLGAALIDAVEAVAVREGWPALLLSTFSEVPWNAPYYRRLKFEDLPDATLAPALLEIRAEHIKRGLDETLRVFMRRPVTRTAK